MLNNYVIVGKIYDISNTGVKLKVTNTFKNEFGEYESSIVNITVSNTMLDRIKEYCNINDIVGVKGYIGDNNKLIADKVTFLSSQKTNTL